MTASNLKVEQVPTSSIHGCPSNPRGHSTKQIKQIARSIRRFGFTNPVLINVHGEVIAGHGRLAAARLLGLEFVPVIRLTGLSPADCKALMLADNKIAENSDWDPERLRLVISELVDMKFEIEDLGFDIADIDHILEIKSDAAAADAWDSAVGETVTAAPISRLGDLFQVGPHRLLCADAREAMSYRHILEGEEAGLVFTDPPFNVPISGHVCGLGSVRHEEFAMAAGEMSADEFSAFLRTIMHHMADYSRDGSIHFICMDWRHISDLVASAKGIYKLKNICVWEKDNAGMGSLYRSQHELVAVFKKGQGQHINNVELGKKGRYRTNIWRYPGVNTLRKGRMEDLSIHPTVKPLALVADAIMDCSKVDDLVLDPFGGSGTTIMACQRTKRRAAVIEIAPEYVDAAISRFTKLTGLDAIHLPTGLSFGDLAKARREEPAHV